MLVTNDFGTTTSQLVTTYACTESSCVNPTFAATPDEDLLSGQQVTVTGTEFPPSTEVSLATCVVGEVAMCSSPSTATTDAIGELSIPLVVHRLVGAVRDCLHWGCEVRAVIQGLLFGQAPISFFPVQPDAEVIRWSDGRSSTTTSTH